MSIVRLSPLVRVRLRSSLLAAVAVAALGAVAAESGVLSASSALAQASAPAAGPGSFANIVDRVRAAVVSVKVQVDGSEDQADSDDAPELPFPPGAPFEHFFKRFGSPAPDSPHRHGGHGAAQGSGFFISADGYLVTNNHVVDHATEVTVTMTDGRTLPAKVIGVDAKTDLALLKVSGDNFPFVAFAETEPRVGDWVIAVGNPFGLGGTVTAGIVSARGRDIGSGPYDDFLQIDAPVNHGNSGGPTFDTNGEVVGVNTAIFSPSGGSVGIGFAIASDVVKTVVAQLKQNGVVERGWLGVEIQPVTPDIAEGLGLKNAAGALVAKEDADTPAARAGVAVGDVITQVNGDSVADPKDLARRIAALGPKKTAQLTVLRNGAAQTISVTLGTMPNDKQIAKLEPPADSDRSPSKFGALGLELGRARDGEGVRVVQVQPDSVAADHGIQDDDVILDVGGKPARHPADIVEAMDAAKAAGKKAVLLRIRSGESVRFVALPIKSDS